jgi:hypothetical protein
MLSAADARNQLKAYTMEEISIALNRNGESSGILADKTMYLACLCSKGDIESVKTFIRDTNLEELKLILNTKLYEMWEGTVLHMALYWNTGNQAFDMYTLLVNNGADPVQNYYNCYPWECTASKWIDMIGDTKFDGYRNIEEFSQTYKLIEELEYADMPPLICEPQEPRLVRWKSTLDFVQNVD